MKTDRSEHEFKFAPEHYKLGWQECQRRSFLPYGYFGRGYQPTWRIIERAIFWTLIIGVAALLLLWN
jgi:hypothetical protein